MVMAAIAPHVDSGARQEIVESLAAEIEGSDRLPGAIGRPMDKSQLIALKLKLQGKG